MAGRATELILSSDQSPSTNGWWVFDCPNCDHGRHKKKCAVHYEFNYVKCWECGMRMFLDEYLREFEGFSWAESKAYQSPPTIRKERKSDVALPEHFKLLSEPGDFRGRVLSYLKNRGFSETFIDMKGVGYCDEGVYLGYLIIPFIRSGELVYWIGRDALDRGGSKYVNPKGVSKEVIYNQDALMKYDTIYITEGVFDAWTIGNNAVATLGWQVTDYQLNCLINSSAKKIVIAPDPGYSSYAYTLASKLTGKEVWIKQEATGDVNSIGRRKFMELGVTKFSYRNWIDFLDI